MFPRWHIGLILAAGLMATPPFQPRTQAWVLVLDDRGGMVGDLKPEEFQVKVQGKPRPLVQVKTPAQTAEAAQSWVLVFEPIRDMKTRAVAFTAAADFLTKVPEGDRVFIVARGKDTLESLMPGFSSDRGIWAQAMEKVPGMLPETLSGIPTGRLEGRGFDASYVDKSIDSGSQEKLNALLARFRGDGTAWAGGTSDQKGQSAIDRLNLNDSMLVSSLVKITGREMKTLESLLEALGPIPGQKHMIVFSRCESDDLTHPSLRAAMNQNWGRMQSRGDFGSPTSLRRPGDLGGPGETATLAIRDVTIQQQQLKEKAIQAGVMIYSVAGPSPNIVGNLGTIAADTGGFCFPLRSELQSQFGQAIQVFGSRYLLRWSEVGLPAQSSTLDITVNRKGARVLTATQL